MNVKRSWVTVQQGYPTLHIETDLGEMALIHENKMFHYYGLVHAGAQWEDKLPEIELPEDKSIGQGPLTLRGFTDDPEIVRLYKRFLAWDGGEWHVGDVNEGPGRRERG